MHTYFKESTTDERKNQTKNSEPAVSSHDFKHEENTVSSVSVLVVDSF